MKTHFRFLVSSVLISLLLTGNLNAQTPSHAALIDGAKKEGKLVWYTSMAIDTSKPLLDAFQKEYPFIKAELVRAGEEQLMNRILSETRAGRWLFDAISTAAMSVVVGPAYDHALSHAGTRRFSRASSKIRKATGPVSSSTIWCSATTPR